jgi:diguanylate cyclase (GGDEF)-like protein
MLNNPIASLDAFAAGAATATALTLATQLGMLRVRGLVRARIEHGVLTASTDPLSGLANRTAFTAALASSLGRNAACGILLLDLDGFRSIRALHGHVVSDSLLHDFATRLASLVAPAGLAARLRGNEFGVLLPMDTQTALEAACIRMLVQLKSTYYPDGKHCDISLSIGAALLPHKAATVEMAMGAANLALDNAKSAGGGVWRLFDANLVIISQQQNALQGEVEPALAAGQFIPYYQPIVELTTGSICGFEVLARWNHPERGLLPPIEFMAMAERQNLCSQLSISLLRQVIRDQRAWPQHWRFAFNAAPSQLQALLAFARDRAQVPADMISPARLDLEITENALIGDLDLARSVVRAMHKGGTQVVLDDFGTGYANFMHLREIPFDRIKIDKSFVTDMLTDNRGEACVRAMLALGANLGVAVTAEGVETEAVAERLRDMGCTHAQGYFYAPPVPASEVAAIANSARFKPQAPQYAAPAASLPPSLMPPVACSCHPSAYLPPPCNMITQAATTP